MQDHDRRASGADVFMSEIESGQRVVRATDRSLGPMPLTAAATVSSQLRLAAARLQARNVAAGGWPLRIV